MDKGRVLSICHRHRLLRANNLLTRYSILPAMLLDRILSIKILEGSFTTDTFNTFMEGLLNVMQPYPAKNSVIVLDNCQIHKDPALVEMIEEW